MFPNFLIVGFQTHAVMDNFSDGILSSVSKRMELSRLLAILGALVKVQSEQAKALIPFPYTTRRFGCDK